MRKRPLSVKKSPSSIILMIEYSLRRKKQASSCKQLPCFTTAESQTKTSLSDQADTYRWRVSSVNCLVGFILKKSQTQTPFNQYELPVRLAHRVRAFNYLPFIAVTNPSILRVMELYKRSFYTVSD